MRQLFIELLQVSLGTRSMLSCIPTPVEWENLFKESKRQALVGVMACGIERLPSEQKPTKKLLLLWGGMTIIMERVNVRATKACGRICERMEKDGFNVCVMKGQANHRYYPEELANRRSCGDIDVWIVPKKINCKNKEKVVIEYVQENYEIRGLCWLHTSYKDESGISVEGHLRPSFMNRPKWNRRFQKHFKNIDDIRTWEQIDDEMLPVMKVEEDVVYQMNHIYRHLIDEGVGLRQVVDYYYCLKTYDLRLNRDEVQRSREETVVIISKLGMRCFAGALMYVLREICGMPADMLLCPSEKKYGQFLMNEILLSGNFGHDDARMTSIKSNGYFEARVKQAWRRFKRNLRFYSSYSGEVLWEPVIRVRNFMWKRLKLWRW